MCIYTTYIIYAHRVSSYDYRTSPLLWILPRTFVVNLCSAKIWSNIWQVKFKLHFHLSKTHFKLLEKLAVAIYTFKVNRKKLFNVKKLIFAKSLLGKKESTLNLSMNLQRGLLSIHDRWLPVCIYLHTTRSYVYIWTSYLYLTFTDIHIQIGIRGVPEFRRQNFRNLLELRWKRMDTFIRKYLVSLKFRRKLSNRDIKRRL